MFELRSHGVVALPIINAFLDRLGIDERLGRAMPADPRARLAPATALGVVLRNIIEARTPLYALGEWAQARDAACLRLPEGAIELLNDDRVGRALDRLFDCDRASLASSIAVAAIRRFAIALDEFHNDSTTLTFQGRYEGADGKRVRGKTTARITYGHNKDHRPDLKQLLWILTVASDGAVPVHYRVADGNTSDSETHTEVWNSVAALAGRKDFLYVADSKLCASENMGHIASGGGRFLTVCPRTRLEDRHFREWVQTHLPEWELVRQNGILPDGSPDAYFMCEAPWPSAEGYRVAWVLSASKKARDALSRQDRIKQASERLDELAAKLAGPKARIRTKAGADSAASAILADTGTNDYFDIALEEMREPTFSQERRGRPGTRTRYRRKDQLRIKLAWTVRDQNIRAEAASDGMFPLITNDRALTLRDLLDHYKYQPCLERRHAQLKSGLEVVPMWLKSVARIEAILLLYFVALLVRALIEREVRRRMKDEDLETLPLYPEDRDCPAPSAERILAIFGTVQRHQLWDAGRLVQTFEPELTGTQRRVLGLLGLSASIYRSPSAQ